MRFGALTFFAMMLLFQGGSQAAIITIDFNSVVPVPVTPGSPLVTSGFTFTPAVNDGSTGVANGFMPGNATNYFVFGGGNSVTISRATPFDLLSLRVGPTTDFGGTLPLGKITAVAAGPGSTDFAAGAMTSTLWTLPGSFTNLLSVTFMTDDPTDNVGLDDIVLQDTVFAAVPEPGSFALIGAIGAFGVWKRRRGQKVA